MARQSETMQVAGRFITPDEDAGWVRTGDTTAVPTLFRAFFLLSEPPVQVHLKVRVDPAGRAKVDELALVPNDMVGGAITTTVMRSVAVDALMRDALERAAVEIELRPDFGERAFQVPGDPTNSAWVSPDPAETAKGKRVSRDRVERAAQIYLDALRGGSHAPAEVVAKEMGYSRATAARDLRAARARKLLPPPGQDGLSAEENAITGTGRITRMPMSDFVEARTRIEEELGMRKHPGAASAPESKPDPQDD